MIRVRESFGTKLLATLLGTVGLLLGITYLVVRGETARQVELAADRAVRNARTLSEELIELQRQQADQLARPFTDGRRALALFEAAIEAEDVGWVADQVDYEMQLAGLTDVLVVFTDARARPVISIVRGERIVGSDPAGVSPLAAAVLDGDQVEARSYRVLEGRLYNVRTIYIERAFQPIGTITFGLPLEDADVQRIGSVGGAEICYEIGGSCVIHTPGMNEEVSAAAAATDATDALRISAAGASWALRSEPLVAGQPEEGSLVLAVPLDEVLAPFERISNALLLGGGGALLLSILIGGALTRSLARPIRELVRATGRVAGGDYESEVTVRTRDEIGTLGHAFNEMTRGLLLRERYRSVLSMVVSQDIAEELMRGEVELGGENRQVSVLFADIRGFTRLTEGMEPQDVVRLLNECMQHLSSAVDAEGGVVDKFMGDELMAVFGAPAGQEDHARRAVAAAVRMKDAMERLNALRAARGQAPIGLGIGVNSGEALAGNMGSVDRLNYTVLGATVNLGSRLCAQAEAGEVLVTRETLRLAGPGVLSEPRGAFQPKGFSSPVEAFAVTGLREVGPPAPRAVSGAAVVLPLAALALGLAAPTAASGQDEWPTLAGAGVGYMSESGAVQIDLSGQLDLEGFLFSRSTPGLAGLAYGSDALFAPRLRVFTDVFLGDHVYGLLELRGDRGEAPTDSLWQARVEQAYLRLASSSGSIGVQAGLFASPFGSYAQRHMTRMDPFVRPPLAYDYRTLIYRSWVPEGPEEFLAQREPGNGWRPWGAPPVWGVPYQWGAMLMGGVGPFALRFAGMNSAPSSEPDDWYELDLVEGVSWVGGVQAAVTAGLSLGASFQHGPFMETPTSSPSALPGYVAAPTYDQTMFSADATFARGPFVTRAEFIHDAWEIPNLADDVVELAYSVETQMDLAAGVSAALRWGRIDFREYAGADWDWDVDRYEAALGYRFARNAGILSSYAHTRDAAPTDADDDLLSVRLWWAF